MTAKRTPAGGPRRRRLLSFSNRHHRREAAILSRTGVPVWCLPDGWFAVEQLVVEDTSIPLVVVGMKGMYVVAAFDTGGAAVTADAELTIAGRPQSDLLEASTRHAAILTASLGHVTKPLLVFSGGTVQEGWVGETRILARETLRSFLIHAQTTPLRWDDFKRVHTTLHLLAG